MNLTLDTARHLVADALQLEPGDVPDDAGIETLARWDSLNHLRVVAAIETRLGRALGTEEVLEIVDLASVASLLHRAEERR